MFGEVHKDLVEAVEDHDAIAAANQAENVVDLGSVTGDVPGLEKGVHDGAVVGVRRQVLHVEVAQVEEDRKWVGGVLRAQLQKTLGQEFGGRGFTHAEVSQEGASVRRVW